MGEHLVGAAEVARILGVSRQRVSQLVIASGDFPAPAAMAAGGRIWRRETIERWAVTHQDRGPRRGEMRLPPPGLQPPMVGAIVGVASSLAFDFRHTAVGPEHILLALVHPNSTGAAREVLESLGLTFEVLRPRVIEAWRESTAATPPEFVTVNPAAQLTLERANLKALELEDYEVRSEHVLLALLDTWVDIDFRPVERWGPEGIEPATVRERVAGLTEAAGAADDTTEM